MTGYILRFGEQGCYSPDGRVDMDPEAVDAHNRKVEDAELAFWASKPNKMLAYVSRDGKQVTTWLGTVLGSVIDHSEWTNNLGARMEYFRIRGTNGAVYYGQKGRDYTEALRLRRVNERRER